jgi:hypothetical protein
MNTRLKRMASWFDAALAIVLVLLSLWLIYSAYDQAAGEKAAIGHAVDAGAIAYMVAVVYCIPSAILFGIAALSYFRNWRIARALQSLAVGWVAVAIGGSVLGYLP